MTRNSARRQTTSAQHASSDDTTRPAVALIGLGIMGSAMAGNLLKAGHAVIGFDVLPRARKALDRQGGRSVTSIAAIGGQAGIVITSLPSIEAMRTVAAELAEALPRRDRAIVIETSTLPIEVKEEARQVLARSGATLLDCPLSGTGAQARTRDLVVFASGPRPAIRRVVPVFEAIARAHFDVGAFGTGSKLKFIANLLVAIHNVSTAEAVVMGRKAGIAPELLLEVIGAGAGSSRMLQVRGPMMAARDYSQATMKVGLWQKDMRIILEFARNLGCPTPLLSATEPIYNAAMAQGHELDDTASVCAVLEQMAGIG